MSSYGIIMLLQFLSTLFWVNLCTTGHRNIVRNEEKGEKVEPEKVSPKESPKRSPPFEPPSYKSRRTRRSSRSSRSRRSIPLLPEDPVVPHPEGPDVGAMLIGQRGRSQKLKVNNKVDGYSVQRGGDVRRISDNKKIKSDKEAFDIVKYNAEKGAELKKQEKIEEARSKGQYDSDRERTKRTKIINGTVGKSQKSQKSQKSVNEKSNKSAKKSDKKSVKQSSKKSKKQEKPNVVPPDDSAKPKKTWKNIFKRKKKTEKRPKLAQEPSERLEEAVQ